jgi:hypothetical protein
MAIDLRDSRAKIERAEEHSDSLKAIISPMESIGTADDAYLVQLSAKLDRQSGYHVFHVAAIPEVLRLGIGIISGDVVHNLRGALDYLFWQLYCNYIRVPRSPREAEQVQFPIEDTSQRLTNKWVHLTGARGVAR